jgi:anti-sigma regulatory factor (Ser/Thr protein kinase)
VLPQVRVPIDDRSEVGAARRTAADLIEAQGFDETQAGKVGLCVTEAANNIVKHAGRGQILLRLLERGGVHGLEMLALDRGPGIANVSASLRDGVSTAGSPGTGLGALSRMSEKFEVYAPTGRGSALRLEIWPQPSPPPEIEIGAVCLPKQGEPISGDAWVAEAAKGCLTLLVADGLGHGTEAARASMAATRVLVGRPDGDLTQMIEACHRALAPTRGAAVAVGRVIPAEQKGSFSGVGNIACLVQSGENRRQLVSHNGTLGHNLRRVQQFEFDFPRGALLIFHTDGLATHWNLGEYPGLANRHPGLIAGVLYRDHERGRDDVTVIVIRNESLEMP